MKPLRQYYLFLYSSIFFFVLLILSSNQVFADSSNSFSPNLTNGLQNNYNQCIAIFPINKISVIFKTTTEAHYHLEYSDDNSQTWHSWISTTSADITSVHAYNDNQYYTVSSFVNPPISNYDPNNCSPGIDQTKLRIRITSPDGGDLALNANGSAPLMSVFQIDTPPGAFYKSNKIPLIFIPGIMGSKLAVTGSDAINPIQKQKQDANGNCIADTDSWSYNQGDLIWVDENTVDFITKTKPKISDSCSNYLDVLQFDRTGQPLYPQVGINRDIIHSIYDDGTTNTAIPYLEQQGYTLNKDLFIFPYDWRQDIAISETQLEASVSGILTQTGASKVDVMAHSMGGLLARSYINDPSRAAKVHTLVELGTPHAGSPKFVAQLLYNTCPLHKLTFFCVPNGQEANKLVQNFPGAFELLPSSLYYQLYPDTKNYPFNDFRDIDKNNVTDPLNYTQLHTLLNNEGKNMTAFATAENFHNSLDSGYSNTHGVNDYLIAGSGQATIGQIRDYKGVNFLNLTRLTESKISQDADVINGDGTVPLLSASLNQTNNIYYTKQEHSELPQGAGLEMAVNLLNGITDPSSVPDNAVQTTPFDYNGRLIGIYSPAQLDAYDDQNNHTGIASDGTIEENIPGSSYDEVGEAKFIYLPSGGHYHITTKATGEGSFDLKVKDYSSSQLTKQTLYLNIEQTSSTTATMNLDDTNPILSVDESGDGTNIQSFSPSYTLTGSAAADYTPPYTTATLSPTSNTNGTYTNPVSVTLSSTAASGFSIATTYYTIDGGSQQTYSSPFTVSGVGDHTITYWSVDNEGLTEIQNTKTFTIAASIIAQDTFQRANQSHWGTASDGNVWGSDASSNSTFSISGNAGQVANTGGTTYTAILGSTAADTEVVVMGKLSSFTNDPNIGAVSRFTDENNWYKAYIDGDSLVIQKKVQGATTTLKTSPFLAAANIFYTIKFQVIGTTLQARVWQTDQTEPQTWQASVTDTSLSSGNTGLRILTHDASATVTNFTSSNLSMTPTPTLTPTPAPSTVISQDTFTRTNQTHWGTASDGHTWLGDANTASAFFINSNTGKVVSNGTSYSAILGVTAKNAQVLFSGSLSSFASSNIGSVVRWTDTNNWYKAYIDGSNIIIQKKVNGTATTLKTVSFAASAGTNYTLRFQVIGTALSAKVWKTTETEPSNWTATVSDTSLSSGYCGLRMLTQNTISASYTSFIATSL